MIHDPQGTSQREDAKQAIAHAKRGSGGDGTWAPPHEYMNCVLSSLPE